VVGQLGEAAKEEAMVNVVAGAPVIQMQVELVGGKAAGPRRCLFSVRLRAPDQAELANVRPRPRKQFVAAQHALEGAFVPRGAFGFDDLVDSAAFASEFCHAASMRLSGIGGYAPSF